MIFSAMIRLPGKEFSAEVELFSIKKFKEEKVYSC